MKKPSTDLTPTGEGAAQRATKARKEPQIVIKGHETFEHLGMTATMIDGVVHFLDRSYARNTQRIENMIGKTINETSLNCKHMEHFIW